MEFPGTKRDFFVRLAEVRGDLDDLMSLISWPEVKPHMVYSAVLGRMPEAPVAATFDARQAFHDAVNSDEFRSKIVEDFLTFFPEKKRRLFVHIPRTGGSTLEKHLSDNALLISNSMSYRDFVDDASFTKMVADVAERLNQVDEITVGGHIPLWWYLERNLIRANDSIFTIFRDPTHLRISFANYVATVVLEDVDGERSDTRVWLRHLNMSIEKALTHTGSDLARMVLFHDVICPPNQLCTFMGGRDFVHTYNMLRRCNLQICMFTDYRRWFASKWGTEPIESVARSMSYLNYDQLGAGDRRRLIMIDTDDTLIYRAVEGLSCSADLTRCSLDLPPLDEA